MTSGQRIFHTEMINVSSLPCSSYMCSPS